LLPDQGGHLKMDEDTKAPGDKQGADETIDDPDYLLDASSSAFGYNSDKQFSLNDTINEASKVNSVVQD
jgi:hypothetical protein